MPLAMRGASIRIRLVRQSSMDQTSERRINAEGAIMHGVDRGRSPHQQLGAWRQDAGPRVASVFHHGVNGGLPVATPPTSEDRIAPARGVPLLCGARPAKRCTGVPPNRSLCAFHARSAASDVQSGR